MKTEVLFKIYISIGVLVFSFLVFSLLQNEAVYKNTLGQFSTNYTRIETKEGSQIIKTEKSFEEINHTNMYRWDAKLYKCISDSAYKDTDFYFKERLAFYPLFSLVWRATTIDSPMIFIFNYFLFAFSLIWVLHLFKRNDKSTRFIFVLALLLPPSMVYYLPYAEPLFVFTFVAAIAGLMQKKYWLFFIGALAFSMTRPAAQIFILAIIAADMRYFIQHKKIAYFFKEIALKIAPFALGIFLVTCIQYLYSGSWTAYFDSLTFWPVESGLTNKVLDWSVEGFGMTVFCIFFIALPCLVYTIVWGIKSFKKQEAAWAPVSLFAGNAAWVEEYIFNTAMLFIAGNLCYTFLTSGNVLNGFYRYTVCVPFFYIVLFLVPYKIKDIRLGYKLGAVGLSIVCTAVFFMNVIYGGNRFRFEYLGLYVMLLLLLLFILESYLSAKKKWLILAIIIIPALVWHTYLFNMYLSDGWIFT
jgi:hypothetical protein